MGGVDQKCEMWDGGVGRWMDSCLPVGACVCACPPKSLGPELYIHMEEEERTYFEGRAPVPQVVQCLIHVDGGVCVCV
jgi:hypothetical protein